MRRRLAAAAVLALLVAGGAWRLVPRADETKTGDAAPATPASVTAAPEPPSPSHAAMSRVEPPRPRRRATPPNEETTPVAIRTFHGRAVFADGRPAIGARVRVFDLPEPTSGSSQIGDESVVGRDGRFEIVETGEERRGVVYGVLPGFAYDGVWASPADDIVLTFVPGGVVTGTVFDAGGRPLPDVAVRLVRCDEQGRVGKSSGSAVWRRPEIAAFYTQGTRTDSAGRYRIGGAPLADTGKHSVAVVDGPDGTPWRSDVATFQKSGGELVRDVHVGAKDFNGWERKDPLRRVEGRVTDTADRTIEGAVVVYGVLVGGTEKERKTVATDDAGRFVIDLGDEFERGGRDVEVRVSAIGYWKWRGAPPKAGEILRVAMSRWDREPRPGRVFGTAVDVNERPVEGPIVLDVADDFFKARRERVVADERGMFVVEGLWQGTWRISIDGGAPVDVVVRDADDARVRLRATHDAASFVVAPWTEQMTTDLRERTKRYTELIERASQAAAEGETREQREARRRELASERGAILELEERRRNGVPRRDVVVTGVPRAGSYVVSAETDDFVVRVEAKDGVARFVGLPTGTLGFRVERFGVPTPARTVAVVAGEGEQTIELNLPK